MVITSINEGRFCFHPTPPTQLGKLSLWSIRRETLSGIHQSQSVCAQPFDWLKFISNVKRSRLFISLPMAAFVKGHCAGLKNIWNVIRVNEKRQVEPSYFNLMHRQTSHVHTMRVDRHLTFRWKRDTRWQWSVGSLEWKGRFSRMQS